MARSIRKRGGSFVASLTSEGKNRLKKRLPTYQWMQLKGASLDEGRKLLYSFRTGKVKSPRKRR